jgi:hypothetical protein
MKKLLDKRGDLIIVFQTQSLRRTLGRAKKGYGDQEKMTCFLGNRSWKECKNDDELLESYINKLRSKRDYVKPIKLRGKYELDIILACRSGPYTSAWDSLQRRLRHVTNKDAELALRMLKGEVTALTDFFKPDSTLNRWLKID